VYDVRLAKGVEEDLKKVPVFYRNRILDAIEAQLVSEPDTPTKNRKLLENLVVPWEAVPPIWELRVGEYRVFYDVSQEGSAVYIRAIRRKPRGKRTEDIL
jgi:mRNA-degrading endonuclease RelE of RelBE toxin-antitoxin system